MNPPPSMAARSSAAILACIASPAPVLAQGCPVSFLPSVGVPASSGSYAVLATDLNGDDIPDVATANSAANNVNLWLNPALGIPPASAVGSPGSPSGVTAGRFGVLGATDLAVTAFTANAVYIHPSPATGLPPIAPTAYAAGPQPFGIVTADFNGDGRADLAVSNFGASTVSILIANAAGGFLPRRTAPAGSANIALTTGDFNADGRPDLAVANFHAGTVTLLINDGAANFTPLPTLACGGAPRGIVAADFNADGLDDLAVCSNADGTVSTLINAGNGSFLPRQIWPCGPSPQSVAVGDLNNDGILDLVVPNFNSGVVTVLTGTGGGIFRPPVQFATGPQPTSVSIVDVSGDGLPDLLVSTFAGQLSILINSTPTVRIARQPEPLAAIAGGRATFEIEASSADGAVTTYRWFKDGEPVADGPRTSGSTTTRLTITPLQASDAGTYHARVATPCGSILGRPAALIVEDCPADFDRNNAVDLLDLLDFLSRWNAGCP